MVRQMLHQVRQSDLCFAKGTIFPRTRWSRDSRTRLALSRLPLILTAPQRCSEMHPDCATRLVVFSNLSRRRSYGTAPSAEPKLPPQITREMLSGSAETACKTQLLAQCSYS